MKPLTTTSIASRFLFALLESAGKPADDVLTSAGLSREELNGSESAMPLEAFRELWARAAIIKPDIGVTLVEQFPAGQMHILAHLASRSATVGAALEDVCRYAKVTSVADELTLVRDVNSVRFSYKCRADEIRNPWMAEHYLSMTVLFLTRATGCTPPIRAVEFAHTAKTVPEAYRNRFSVDPHFDAGRNAIEFDAEFLSCPMLTHDDYLHSILERVAQSHQVSVPDSLIDTVRAEIAKSFLKGKTPGIDLVATSCLLSTRALRDRLAQVKTSFRLQLDEVRRDLAKEHLARGLSVTETSYLLGFSEPAALQHACKRWFKKSGGELRPKKKINTS